MSGPTPGGEEETILRVRVADQAELFRRLRRTQDLNLRLLRVALEPLGRQELSSPEASYPHEQHKEDIP